MSNITMPVGDDVTLFGVRKAGGAAWNFDLTNIPRGRLDARVNEKGKTYHVYVMQTVWLANRDGKVYQTHWVPKDAKDPSIGSWAGWRDGEEPVAWQPFVKPEFPAVIAERKAAEANLNLRHAAGERA